MQLFHRLLTEVVMSFDTMLGSAAVASVFAVFAVFAIVLFWGDFQTRAARQKTPGVTQRRRSF